MELLDTLRGLRAVGLPADLGGASAEPNADYIPVAPKGRDTYSNREILENLPPKAPKTFGWCSVVPTGPTYVPTGPTYGLLRTDRSGMCMYMCSSRSDPYSSRGSFPSRAGHSLEFHLPRSGYLGESIGACDLLCVYSPDTSCTQGQESDSRMSRSSPSQAQGPALLRSLTCESRLHLSASIRSDACLDARFELLGGYLRELLRLWPAKRQR